MSIAPLRTIHGEIVGCRYINNNKNKMSKATGEQQQRNNEQKECLQANTKKR